MHNFSDLNRQIRWYRVSYLDVLLSPVALKKVVIRKRLKPSGFSRSQAPALLRVRMNVIVSILGYVASYRR